MALDDTKETGSFISARFDLLELIPKNPDNKILEIGAAGAATLMKAKELGLAKEVVGIDLTRIENSFQDNPKIDRFIIGDIETIKLDFENDYFDVVICADVLEHLVNPWKQVKRLSQYLKRGGVFISSIPNFRNYRALSSIVIKGDFQYVDSGLLDKTHLRFFCKRNIIGMFEVNGYNILSIKTNLTMNRLKQKLINLLAFAIPKDFFVFQYLIVAKKK